MSTVLGILERIVYHNEENGFSVVRVQLPPEGAGGGSGASDGRVVTAVGNLLGLSPGESVRLEGRWVQDRTYGEQLKVERFETIKPASLVGIERYLASGLVKGMGPALAARLVEHFGLQTLEVIEQQPERLREVPGIGPVRQQRMLEAWAEQRDIRQVMVFLQSHGVSSAFAVRIYKRYGSQAVAVVSENPYQLAVDVHGIGFLSADRIAASLGIAADSPRRAEAAAQHVLGEASDEGHLYLPRQELLQRTALLLARPREGQAPDSADEAERLTPLADAAVGELGRLRHVVLEPLPEGDEAVYLSALFTAEAGAAERLRTLLAVPVPPVTIDVEKAIGWFEQQQGIQLGEEQRQAIRSAPSAKLLVITGGPGTGKTTLLKGILQILEKKGRRIALAAPTGRAAQRMTEAVGMAGHQARTLHRLLEFSPREQGFLRSPKNPLEADVCIVDEVSMVDALLFYHLLGALAPRCQLILVGDIDQLPSVGPGAVLGEVIRSGRAEVVRLMHIFRQAEQSLIVVNAHRINRGELPVSGQAGTSADCFLIERETPEQVQETLRELVVERIPRRFGFDPVDDVQVLTPMLRGSLGVTQLNSDLQALLNPPGRPGAAAPGETLARGSRTFRVGDKVMQLRNNYDLEVYNGDVGRLVAADPAERTALVRFDGREVTYDLEDLDELALAYACSIHKSQGSEYPCVVIVLHTQHYVMLQRNLLYTALTRGKRLVVLIGPRRALALAVKNHQIQARYTRLAERLGHPGPQPGAATQ